MKTYSRLKRASYPSSEPSTKRRRILDDDALSLSSDAALLHSDAARSPPRTTPPRKTTLVSSTPPSSPPPPVQVTAESTSPLQLPKRKTTFSFFARRAEAAARTATMMTATKTSPQPLTEQRNANNAQASSPASSPTIPPPAPSGKSNGGKGRDNKQQPQRRLTQLQLDLGVTPVQRTCKTCGMAYVPSNAEDAALHKRFHAMNVGGVDVGKGFFLSRSGGGGGGEVVWEKGVDGDFVVAVGRRGKAAAKTRVRKVLEVVERELGAVEIPEDELWGQVVVEGEAAAKGARKEEGTRDGQKTDVDDGVEPKPQRAAKSNKNSQSRARGEAVTRADRFKAYLYIRGSKCIGLCLAERITEAHRVVAPPNDSSNLSKSTDVATTEDSGDQKDSKDTTQQHTDTPSNQHSTRTPPTTTPGTLTTSPTTHPADLGISRIWVSSSHRRHGIAIALLDAVARDFCAYRCEEYDANGDKNGKRLPKERIAFSQPTDGGARLARKWFRAETGWSVYW
ncbi:hypothetical protein DIS24_g6962 [Lasiodiplodia hormozganensis]|uniref:N-acetyltransferase ECO1 n=1 Tax=Lasiodiplodia hormozganensis TaxID=869390 RepID=A0AA39YFY4_9PEZI|nr:hypothetical protein DIS24_g6962 [Lasiodiplodia hormozganensis]